jgi:sorting nexin-41/42
LHEYSQFASIIKKLLAYRHQKHVQLEMTQDALESRRETLSELEKSEREARRLEEALDRGHPRSIPATSSSSPTSSDAANDDGASADAGEGEGINEQHENPASVFLPPHPGPSPVKRRAPGMGLLSALSYTIHGMMDADPESARRSGISKTRETISQVAALVVRTTVDG